MADWTNITDTAVDPDAPLTSQLGYAWRDNPIAIAEGAAGAPRNMLASLPRLVAGSNVRASLTNSLNLTDAGSLQVGVRFGVIQFGTLRIVSTASGGTGGVSRTRGGVVTTLSSSFGSLEVDCIPGDLFSVSATQTFGSVGGTLTVTASLRTNGVDLWPAEGLWGNLTGNAAAP